MYILRECRMEKKRRTLDYVKWVLYVIEQYSKDRDSTVYTRRKGTEVLKRFFEESIPLYKLCEYYLGKKVLIKHKLGNQQYDVQVSNHKEFKYIEITLAINGEAEKHRMDELNKTGGVSANGRIAKSGNKTSNEFKVLFDDDITDDMIEVEEKHLYELIREAVEKKTSDKKQYPYGTLLLIYFDDGIGFYNNECISDFKQFAKKEVFSKTNEKFVKTILLGSVKNILVES